MASVVHPQAAPSPFLTEWLNAINQEVGLVEAWARGAGWQTERSATTITEEPYGSYDAPVLQIQTGSGLLYLEPVGRNILGAVGRIDLYAWPSLFRVHLLRVADGKDTLTRWRKTARTTVHDQPDTEIQKVVAEIAQRSVWKVRTESGIDWPNAWSEDTFVALAQALVQAE